MRFLVIDDNPADRELIARELRKEFPTAEFVQIYRRKEFEDALAAEDFDVVLTDYQLNWTDGLSVLKMVAAKAPGVPVIMVTDSGGEEVAVEGMKLGLSDYITKRRLTALCPAVKQALEAARLRREHEDALSRLAASERRYRILVETADYGVFLMDPDGVLLEVNRKILEDTGLAVEDLVGKSVAEVENPDFRERYIENVRSVVRTRKPIAFEHPITMRGRPRWHLDMLYPIISEDGTVVAVGATYMDVTARKEAEQALHESEERYRVLADSSPVAVMILQDDRLVYLNPAALHLAGMTLEEAQQIHYLDVVHPDDRDRLRVFLESRMAEETAPERLEIRLLSPAGVRYVEIHATRIMHQGRPALLGVAVDITERKQAEQALAEQRTLLRSVLDAVPDVIYAKDMESRFIVANRALADCYNLEPEDFVGKTDFDLTDPERAARFRDEELSVLESGQPLDLGDSLWKHARLGLRWYHTVKVPMRDESGKIVGLIGIGRDVTQRRLAEEEHMKLSMVVENSDVGIVMLGKGWRIQYANPAFLGITGRAWQDLQGKQFESLTAVPHEHSLSEVVRTAEQGQPWEGRVTITRPDGQVRETQASVFPVKDESGGTVGYAGLYRDITDPLKLEEQFQQAQKMEAIGRLAGGIAHDFNNMLTVILGMGQLLSVRLADPDLIRCARQIVQAAEQSALLTQQLLAFSRKQIVQPKLVDLGELVQGMRELLRRLVGEDVQLATFCAPDLWKVRIDPGQASQIIMNLAVNAKDAMPTGGKLTIELQNVYLDEAYVRTHTEASVGPHVLLAISDTGHGIDAETLPHVFEPFFTTKERGKGTGLGLSTVYGIVKQSGGSIWVYSEVGQGTTFKIYLPKAEEAPAEEERAEARHVSRGGGECVLVVEDDDMVRSLVAEILESRGYEVVAVADPTDVDRICRERGGRIDLLLTDVVMPGMSGRELAERMAEVCPQMKVLYMSGYTENAVVRHGVLLEGVQYLQKPFTEEMLLGKVREVLDS